MKDIINLLSKLFTKKSYSVHKNLKPIFIICIIVLFSFTTSCKVKVVNLDDKEVVDEDEIKVYFDEGFDASLVIDPNWDTKIVPYFIEEAVDINVLLDEAVINPLATTEKYAYTETEENTNYNFIVKGTGNIISVNDVSKGSLNIDLAPYDNKTDVIIVIGPIISSTLNSIRDSYTDLSYGDFVNQLEWAKIGNRIKDIIKETVVNNLDIETLHGNTISFYGAFTLVKPDDYSEIIITPIKLEIEED